MDSSASSHQKRRFSPGPNSGSFAVILFSDGGRWRCGALQALDAPVPMAHLCGSQPHSAPAMSRRRRSHPHCREPDQTSAPSRPPAKVSASLLESVTEHPMFRLDALLQGDLPEPTPLPCDSSQSRRPLPPADSVLRTAGDGFTARRSPRKYLIRSRNLSRMPTITSSPDPKALRKAVIAIFLDCVLDDRIQQLILILEIVVDGRGASSPGCRRYPRDGWICSLSRRKA